MPWKYFKESEFDDPTLPGSGNLIDPELVDKLDQMREICGFRFDITSGVRTRQHNKDVGGKTKSDHLVSKDGKAHGADIACTNGKRRMAIVAAALQVGIRRIGPKKDCVHIGNNPDLPQDVLFTYD